MSPTTRSDSLKKKVQTRDLYSRTAKRKLDSDFAATTIPDIVKETDVSKLAVKKKLKPLFKKSQKRKRPDKVINTPIRSKKAKDTEETIVSDDDFQSTKSNRKKNSPSCIKIGIGRAKFAKDCKVVKKTIQFRCTKPVYSSLNNPVTDGVKRIISQTPFAQLFEAFIEGKVKGSKSNIQIGMILSAYNHEADAFFFGKTQIDISYSDVSQILGLNMNGRYICNKKTQVSDFVNEAFGKGTVWVKKKDVATAIQKELMRSPDRVIDVRSRDENLSRLLLIDMCIKFLFPNGMGQLHIKYVRALEDLNEISNYAWAKEVAIFLREKLVSFKTRDCSTKNTGGCAYIILYWLCMKTNIISAMDGMEEENHLIRRWNLDELKNILKKMNFKDLSATFNTINQEGHNMTMEKLIEEVQKSKREIVLLKNKATAQELKIQRLEMYIEQSVPNSSTMNEGKCEPTNVEGVSADVDEEHIHEPSVPHMEAVHVGPTFDIPEQQSDPQQLAIIVRPEVDDRCFGSPISEWSVQIHEEEMDKLCIQAAEEYEQQVKDSANKQTPRVETTPSNVNHAVQVLGMSNNIDPWKCCSFEPPSFDLLSQEDFKTPIQNSIPHGSSTILPLDDMFTGSTGTSIGIFSYADLPENIALKPRNDAISHWSEVKKNRILRNNRKRKSDTTVIEVDDLEVTYEVKIQHNRWDKNKFFQFLLDDPTRMTLKEFLELGSKGVSFWKGNETGLTDITCHEIDLLLSGKELTNIIIDAFSCLLSQELKSRKNKFAITEFLVTHAWIAAEKLDTIPMHDLIFEPLYEYLGSANMIMIPLTHGRPRHFTLLMFDTTALVFFHYDSMSRTQPGEGESLRNAKKMVALINLWFQGVEFQAEYMLQQGSRQKLNKGESTDTALKMDRVPLTEKDISTVKWVQQNYKTDFPLSDETEDSPKQACGSLDCGVYVMRYMESLATDSYLFDPFEPNDYRCELIKRFAASPGCWRAPR